MRTCAALLASLLACACATEPRAPSAPAAPEGKPQPTLARSCHRVDAAEVAVLDETRRRLEETVCGAALWFDRLFGEGNVGAARHTHGYVEALVAHSDYEGWATRVRFNAHIRVPSLEERFSAFIGRDNDHDFVRDRGEGNGLRSIFPRTDEDDWLAGLGYSFPEAWNVHVDVRPGPPRQPHPPAWPAARHGRTPCADDDDALHLRGTPFVNTRDGLGFTASADLDHALNEVLLLRWGSIGTVSQNSAGLDWRTAVILYQNLGHQRALGYEVFVRGATAAPVPLGEYGLRTIYRQPLVRDRLIGELVVGYSWPQSDPAVPREGSFGVSVGVTLPFGRYEPLARN